jgi:hypothetical protein
MPPSLSPQRPAAHRPARHTHPARRVGVQHGAESEDDAAEDAASALWPSSTAQPRSPHDAATGSSSSGGTSPLSLLLGLSPVLASKVGVVVEWVGVWVWVRAGWVGGARKGRWIAPSAQLAAQRPACTHSSPAAGRGRRHVRPPPQPPYTPPPNPPTPRSPSPARCTLLVWGPHRPRCNAAPAYTTPGPTQDKVA